MMSTSLGGTQTKPPGSSDPIHRHNAYGFIYVLLEKMPISCVLEAFDSRSELLDNSSQLILFEF